MHTRHKAFSAIAAFTLLSLTSLAHSPGASAADDFTDEQLAADCAIKAGRPASGGTGQVKHLDACTFENEEWSYDVIRYKATGPTVRNCDGSPSYIDHRMDVTESFTSEVSYGGDGGIKGPFYSFKLGGNKVNATTKSVTNSSSFRVEPNHKATLRTGINMHGHHGRMRLNYDTPVNGHYVWYINGFEYEEPTSPEYRQLDMVTCDGTLSNGE